MKDILERIIPQDNPSKFWLLFWFLVFQAVCVVSISIATAVSIKSYYDRNRPVTTREQIYEELKGMTFHLSDSSPK